MVDTRGRLPLPETPLEYPAIACLYLIVVGGGLSALIAVSALIAPFLPDWVPVVAPHPSTSAIYAEIAAGLSMPVLAVLTYWYASETRRLAEKQEQMHEREKRKDEARIEAFLSSLVEEITSHPNNLEEINPAEYSFATECYEEGRELIQRLDSAQREAIHDYYQVLKLIDSIDDSDITPETLRQLSIWYDARREEAMTVAADSEEESEDNTMG